MGNWGKICRGIHRGLWHTAETLGEADREERWVNGSDLLLGCLILVKTLTEPHIPAENGICSFFTREIFQLVFFNSLIFRS